MWSARWETLCQVSQSGECVRLMGMSDETTRVKRGRIWMLAPACKDEHRGVANAGSRGEVPRIPLATHACSVLHACVVARLTIGQRTSARFFLDTIHI